MIPDKEIEDIATANDMLRKAKIHCEAGDEDAFAEDVIKLSEVRPDLFEDLQPICDILNSARITIGGASE